MTLQFRIDECPASSQDPVSSHPASLAQWGLASTRPCPALQQPISPQPSSHTDGASSTSHGPASAPGSSLPGSPRPPTILQVDSASRKPLHVVCAPPQPSALPHSLSQGDIFTIDLVPKEDRQPSIIATLSLNGTVVQQRSLPCDKINSLQLYPFLILPPGALASLHQAVTPSPLFTWYSPTSPATNGGGVLPAPESQLAELDTCFRYTTLPPSADPAAPPLAPGIATGPPGDLLGSVSFITGRQRWTMQLDNYSSTCPTHIFVGVLGSLAPLSPPPFPLLVAPLGLFFKAAPPRALLLIKAAKGIQWLPASSLSSKRPAQAHPPPTLLSLPSTPLRTTQTSPTLPFRNGLQSGASGSNSPRLPLLALSPLSRPALPLPRTLPGAGPT